MAQSYAQVILHIVFSTKHREPIIPKNMAPDLYAYLAAVCTNHKSHAYRVGGMPDHVHIACTLPRTMSLSKLVEELKTDSSKWLKSCGVDHFYWQGGYGAFSIGRSQLDDLIRYIDNQAEHHCLKTFKEEYEEFLKKYGVNFDPQYIWED